MSILNLYQLKIKLMVMYKQDIVNAMQEIIYESLYKAMKESLDQTESIDMDKPVSKSDMIEAFAAAGKKAINISTTSKLVDAIDAYIKSAGISILASPQAALVCGVGPVRGVINVSPNNVTIS